MRRWEIGVGMEDFRMPVRRAVVQAARIGFRCVELSVARGELKPEDLSQSGRRHVARLVASHGLSVAALDASRMDAPLFDRKHVDQRVAALRAAMAMARDMAVTVVVSDADWPSNEKTADSAAEALHELADYADRAGVRLALLCGARSFAQASNRVNAPSISYGIDTADALTDSAGPSGLISPRAGRLAIVHARDAAMHEKSVTECPIGTGRVNWTEWIASLIAADYSGPLIVRRHSSAQPAADLARDKAFLDEMVI